MLGFMYVGMHKKSRYLCVGVDVRMYACPHDVSYNMSQCIETVLCHANPSKMSNIYLLFSFFGGMPEFLRLDSTLPVYLELHGPCFLLTLFVLGTRFSSDSCYSAGSGMF